MIADGTAQGLFVDLPFLGFRQVFTACRFSIGPRFHFHPVPSSIIEGVDYLFGFLARFVEQSQIVGVGNVLVGNRCIQFQVALVFRGVPCAFPIFISVRDFV